MKTFVPLKQNLMKWLLFVAVVASSVPMKAQTYTTIANGVWSSASTWSGGAIPPAGTIPSTAVLNIKHIITYDGSNNISNYGTINIYNPAGISPRLIVPTNILVENFSTGKFYITDGEYKQYRFTGGGESGTAQNGSFKNNGGYLAITNSYFEVAQDFTNENGGLRVMKNSLLTMGGNYILNLLSVDTLQSTSVSLGWHGNGDFSVNGGGIYFQSMRVQMAGNNGGFRLNAGIANGDIDYITLKNHTTNNVNSSDIFVSNFILTSGLNLDAYCATSSSKYMPNGRVTGPQTQNCSLNYFPATLFGSQTPTKMNFSLTPVLVSGTALQLGAVYKYEGVIPGMDAVVKIDSLIGGATITKIDDNLSGLGYAEGFQPEVKSGSAVGRSYAVFKIDFKISGTVANYKMNTFSITALDIDGNSTLKEFADISVGANASAIYMGSTTDISISQPVTGIYRGVNTAGIERAGIDTSSKANMFTVTKTDLSSFSIVFGSVKTNTVQGVRQYGSYMKAFAYPNQVTLPVKMESFIALLSNDNKKVDLKWTTSSEINVSHFIIEKSTDGINYSDAGVVFAYGTATDKAIYSLSDNIANNQSKVIYYRLRSVDIDGKSQLSETRVIRIGTKTENAVSILTYPNPVINELRVTIPSNWQNKRAVYEIANANGQVTKRTETASSSQTETINVSSLAPGFYIIKVSCEGQTAQQKIIKQ